MSDANDLDTDDVANVVKRYKSIERSDTETLARLQHALDGDARVRVRANAATALDVLPIMDLFGKSIFDQKRGEIRKSLLRALDDEAPLVRVRAASALSQHDLGESAVTAALQKHLAQLREDVANTDENIAVDAMMTLRAMQVALPYPSMLRAPSEAMRTTAIDQAELDRDPTAMPLLIEIVRKDPITKLRRQALQTLASGYRGPEVSKLLEELLEGSDVQLGVDAAVAIGRTKEVSLAPRLRAVVAQATQQERKIAAIRALAKLDDMEAVPVIASSLKEGQPIRGEAAGALDALLKMERSDTEWEMWARHQGYLH